MVRGLRGQERGPVSSGLYCTRRTRRRARHQRDVTAGQQKIAERTIRCLTNGFLNQPAADLGQRRPFWARYLGAIRPAAVAADPPNAALPLPAARLRARAAL